MTSSFKDDAHFSYFTAMEPWIDNGITEYFYINLCPRFLTSSDSEFEVHHILPVPPSPLLARKWDYILSIFNVWYQDSDGDDITLGRCSELVSAIHELGDEGRDSRFYVKQGRPTGGATLYTLMDELNQVKMRYEVIGTGEPGLARIKLDNETKVQLPYEPDRVFGLTKFERNARKEEELVDPAIFEEIKSLPSTSVNVTPVAVSSSNVIIGDNVKMGDNVSIEERETSIPEHDDINSTPHNSSPAPSPCLHPLDMDSEALIDLPCIPLSPSPASLPPAALDAEPTPADIEDPPEEPLVEEEFPNSPFPGAFPRDLEDTPFGQSQYNLQNRLASAVQATLDSLARIGHMTLSAAQGSGIPVSPTAHERMQQNLATMRTNIEANIASTTANLEHTRRNLSSMSRDIQNNLRTRRDEIDRDLTFALANGLAGTRDGLTRASVAMTQASTHVEQALQSAIGQAGFISVENVDNVIRDLRATRERIDRVVQDITLRLQQSIDAHATPRDVRTEEHEGPQGEQQQEEEEMEEDIYGTVPLPGAFPSERSAIDGCMEMLIEMGYFTADEHEMARALSVAVEGDLFQAIDTLESR